MSIELVRIDDRLIHGQVVTSWVKEYNIEQIIVVNDIVAEDEIQKSVLQMTTPPGIKIQVFSVDKFNNIMKKNSIKRRTMLLFTNPIDVSKIHFGNLKIDKLNVGGMRSNPERNVSVSKAVSMNLEEQEAFNKMHKSGVEIFIQLVPKDKKQDFFEN